MNEYLAIECGGYFYDIFSAVIDTYMLWSNTMMLLSRNPTILKMLWLFLAHF